MAAKEIVAGVVPRIREDGIPLCWTRGGLAVTDLHTEFQDPAWSARGQYRALLQFIMNWNNWADSEDRAAMLDGSPPEGMPDDQKARIAAVVHCLCERDGYPIPDWVHGHRARRGGVFLTHDLKLGNRPFWPSVYTRHIRGATPATARRYRVWFDAKTLDKA